MATITVALNGTYACKLPHCRYIQHENALLRALPNLQVYVCCTTTTSSVKMITKRRLNSCSPNGSFTYCATKGTTTHANSHCH